MGADLIGLDEASRFIIADPPGDSSWYSHFYPAVKP
jgi:hypothetical protein